MYPSQSYFSSQNPEIKDGERTVSRLNILIDELRASQDTFLQS